LRDENNTLIPNAIDYTDKRGVVWLGFNKTEKDIWIYIEDKKATQLIPFGRKKVETNIVLPVKKAIATALTNGSGYFSLDLSLGNYELEIEEEGYAKYKEGFNLTEEGLIKNISLSKVVELLIVTNKSALQNKYGDISELINRLEKIKGSKIEFIDPNNYVSAKDQINKLIKESKAKNLLIVGGDSIIPFYRIEDPIPNKNSEFHESGNIAWNLLYPQYNTNGKVLTDDPYTDVIEGSDLRADIPVGRILGVTLDDLINLINNSIKKNKVTLLSGTLVYGEDWTRDVADLIEGYLIKESVSTLYWGETTINPSNTLNLINSDIVFSATHTVPETWYTGAIGANSTFINAEDLNIYLNSDNNPLVITLGCHGALVLENMDLNDSLTLGFIHHGASGFIGNTGFGIVSNEIKYSEAFYSELIRRMLEPDLTIGEVLLNTKQATPFKNPLDKKINLETVFYGNPKNKLNSVTNKIKGLQSKKLYLKASESNYFKETPFHRVIEETDLSTTYTGKMISILEINKEFINNPENTYIINNTIVPYVALSDLKLSENVVIKEIKINHKLSKTELIKLDLPKLDLVGWLPNNTTYKDNISNETIVLNPNWTNIIWETLPEYEGGKLLKTKFIHLKPYNSTHYELYTKVWLEATYTKSLIQISELNISDNIMKVTLANQAQNPENIKINLVLKRTNEEIVDTYTNYLDINATSLASTEFTLNLESGSYIAYIEVIDAKNNILDSKEKWFEVL
ncbi:MAG: C25 family cysteine peptidase, partial [Methanosarcinales archaeon]